MYVATYYNTKGPITTARSGNNSNNRWKLLATRVLQRKVVRICAVYAKYELLTSEKSRCVQIYPENRDDR